MRNRAAEQFDTDRIVDRVITELAVLDIAHEGFRVVELAPGVDREAVVAATDADLLWD